MASYDIPAAEALTTDAGTADGYLVIASNASFFPNAFVWLTMADGTDGGQYQVVDLSGTTKVGLKPASDLAAPNYGRCNLTAFLTGSKISQPAQLVRVNSIPKPS